MKSEPMIMMAQHLGRQYGHAALDRRNLTDSYNRGRVTQAWVAIHALFSTARSFCPEDLRDMAIEAHKAVAKAIS